VGFGDSSFHEQILADDWSVIHPTGQIMTKADVLRDAFSGDRDVTFSEIDEIKVRDFGSFAIVTGRTRVEGRFDGQDAKVTLRFTDVFTHSHGEWQCIASQGTFVNE
jgi:ketosteroid isomerase-like protein